MIYLNEYKRWSFTLKYLFFIIVCLLVGGRDFAKISLIGPLYLADFLYLLLFIYVVVKSGFRFFLPFNLLIYLYSACLLIYSLFVSSASLDVVLRQYMIVFYAATIYFVVSDIYLIDAVDDAVSMLKNISDISVVLQVLYLAVILVSGQFKLGGFNYLSPMVVVGVLIWVAKEVSLYNYSLRGLIAILIGIILSVTFGHSSAVLAVIVMMFSLTIFKSSLNVRIYSVLVSLFLVAFAFWYFPSLIDVNASWRLVYWFDAIERLYENRSYIFGEGFGELYANDKTHYIFLHYFDSSNDLAVDGEGYVKAFHNSYITMFFHLGLISLYFIYPQIRSLFFSDRVYQVDSNFLFLSISLIGLSVWAAFNVILELPLSAHLYWLVFYSWIVVGEKYAK